MSEGDAHTVVFVDESVVSAWSLAIFVTSTVFALIWIRLRTPLKIFTVGLIVAGIPLLPAAISVWGTALLWGLVAGQILLWLNCPPWSLRKRSSGAQPKPLKPTLPISEAAIALSAVCLVLWSSASLAADERALVEEKSWYRILLPVDEAGKPIGETVFVSQSFARRYALSDESTVMETPGFLLETSDYLGEITSGATVDRPRMGVWNVELRGFALESGRWAEFNFDERRTAILPDGVRLNGQPVEWRWSNDHTRLSIRIARAGKAIVTIAFKPITREERLNAGVDFPIPICASNRYVVHAPEETTISTTVAGEWRWSAESRRLTGRGGAIRELSFDWVKSEVLAEETPRAETEVVQYLRLRPGLARMDVRIPIRVLSGQLRKLELAVDERLRLLDRNGDNGTAWLATQQGRTVEIELTRPMIDKGMIEIPFLIHEYGGSGTLAWPRCEIIGQTVKNQWLFGEVDPGLDWEEDIPRGAMTPVDRQLSRTAWGDDIGRPQFAYRITRANPQWKILIKQREPSIRIDSARGWIGASGDQVDWGCEHSLVVGEGSVFRLRAKNAEGWLPRRITLRQQRRTLASRWGVGKDRQITIFPEAPLEGEFQIVMTGKRALAPNVKTAWKWPVWEGKNPEVAELLLEHDPVSLLIDERPKTFRTIPRDTWRDIIKTMPAEHAVQRALTPSSRIVGEICRGKPNDETWNLRIDSNRLQGIVRAATRLERRGDGWWASVELQGELKSGVLDLLELRVSEQCRDVVSIDSWETLEILASGTGGESRLRLRPREPLRGNWAARFEIRLAARDDEALRWKSMRMLTPVDFKETLILSRLDDGRELRWRFVNYRRVDGANDAYVAENQPAEAVLRSDAGGDATARVLEAIHTLSADPSRILGIAEFDLSPSGKSDVRIGLPVGAQMDFRSIGRI
ncbi:MAG: hypothetical protein QM811_14325 [Pirellulales bacterium]